MKEFKQMFIELNEYRKQDPKEFYGGIATMVIFFGGLCVTMWIAAICEGRA
jgi:hypothetical protein